MTTDDEGFRRHSLRLEGFDYSQSGAYYVTICVNERACLFGEVMNGAMSVNEPGRMIDEEWRALSKRFPIIELDEYIIMPNHMHGIVIIRDVKPVGAALVAARDGTGAGNGAALVGAQDGAGAANGAALVGARYRAGTRQRAGTRPAPTLGEMVGAFKSITTDRYIRGVHEKQWPRFNGHLWQRNYFDHVIRNADDLDRIRSYIGANPENWIRDEDWR